MTIESLLCTCGHRRGQHWLSGGSVTSRHVRNETGDRNHPVPWAGLRDHVGPQPSWPPYYRSRCVVKDCGCELYEEEGVA